MTFLELQQAVSQYVYTEDEGLLRVSLASIIATRLNLGDPIWMIIIGPSSSGKSQILRPLALTDPKFIHRVDDLTENTLLSGIQTGKGKDDISLLKRIGEKGIIVVSDFTVIFSKSSETKNAILGQLRMVYDGEMTKYSGNKSEPITWRGSLGVVAGSTPSVYSHFEEVADMGERFIYYRMKDYDIEKATRTSLSRTLFGRELDQKLSDLYAEYIKSAVKNLTQKLPEVAPEVYDRIVNISMFAAKLRTPTHYDKYQKAIDRIPVPEMPMRVSLQLMNLVKGLMAMKYYDTGHFELEETDIKYVEWCAYSLANEERRACLKIFAQNEFDNPLETQTIADIIGLSTEITRMNLQHLSAIGIVTRAGLGTNLAWKLKDKTIWKTVRNLEDIKAKIKVKNRDLSFEEQDEIAEKAGELWGEF